MDFKKGGIILPRFSDQERESIQKKLLTEGERLFAAFGLKKATIDELAAAAAISKGSFYAFYPSKEALLMDISSRLQQRIWQDAREFLDENRDATPHELMRICILWMLSQMTKYPLLQIIDGETIEQLYRKLPPEMIAAHTQEDRNSLALLEEYGVHCKVDSQVAVTLLQALTPTFLQLYQAKNEEAMDILLRGIISEIVE